MPEHGRMISANSLCAGTSFSESLFFDDGNHMFLASGMPLTQRLLDTLHDWEIPFVLTCGQELPPPLGGGEDEECENYEEIPELESVG